MSQPMSSSAASAPKGAISFWGLASAMAVGVVGALIIWMVPGFIGLLPSLAPLDDRQLGYIASWDLNVMAVAIGASAFLLHRINWRWLVGTGLLLMAAGGVATGQAHSYTALVAARVVAGAGEGFAIGLSFAALGRAANTDRAFGVYLVVGAVFSSALLWALPALQRQFGSAMLFYGDAALAAATALTLGVFPDGRRSAEGAHGSARIDWRLATTGLLGVFFYFMVQGAMWGYLERIGQAHHLREDDISHALAIANFAGIGGAATASVLPRKLGRALPLLVSGAVSGLSFLMLAGQVTALVLVAAAVLMIFAWNLSQPLLSGLCCDADAEGRVVAAMGCIQTLGFGIGPAAAALVLVGGNFGPVIWGSCLILLLSLAIVMAGLRRPVAAGRPPEPATQS